MHTTLAEPSLTISKAASSLLFSQNEGQLFSEGAFLFSSEFIFFYRNLFCHLVKVWNFRKTELCMKRRVRCQKQFHPVVSS